MATDLFSSLDGCSSISSWGGALIISLLFFLNSSWSSSPSKNFTETLTSLTSDRSTLAPINLFLFSLMFFLISLNLIGLTPFVYSPTSALWLAGTLALVLWGSLLLSGWMFSPKSSAAHLAPSGTPGALIPFLILIETLSVLIRPLTLTVRLIANISAGHIILSLIANCLTSLSLTSATLIFLVSVGYNMFEVFVGFIQAYIFSLLVTFYSREHPFS